MLAQAASIREPSEWRLNYKDSKLRSRMARQLRVCLPLQRRLCRHGEGLLQLQCDTSVCTLVICQICQTVANPDELCGTLLLLCTSAPPRVLQHSCFAASMQVHSDLTETPVVDI